MLATLPAFVPNPRHSSSGASASVPPPPDSGPPPPHCRLPGCTRPPWRPRAAFCSRRCMNAAPRCAARGCRRPAHDCRQGSYCSHRCRRTSAGFCEEVPRASDRYKDIRAQFEATYAEGGGGEPFKALYMIHPPEHVKSRFELKCEQIGDVPCHGRGRNPGNQQRRFHGSTLACNFSGTPCNQQNCRVCQIIQNGFNIKFLSTGSGDNGWFGAGHYSSSRSSTALGYARGNRALLLVGVAVGKSDLAQGRTNSQIPPGYHSRVADNVAGCAGDELVVPDDDQMLPKYLLIF